LTGTENPLGGIQVLDLGRFPPTAYCSRLLAQQGADVCRVDTPGSDPALFGIGTGLGAAKRSIALDARHPRRNEVLRKLCDWADVVVENSRPGELEERGFGYPQASEEHPELIWCSITGFGQDGPYARWPGHDLTYTAHSGLLGALESEMPWHPQMMLSVPLGAVMAVVGIVSALYSRHATGRGCQLDISLSESATWVLSGFDAMINSSGFSIPTSPDRRLYRCGDDRYVSVTAADPRSWEALCTGLGLDDLAKRRIPGEEWPETTERLAEVFSRRSAAAWVADLGPRGAAVGAVNFGSDLPGDPQVQARRSLIDVDGVLVPTNPIRTGSDPEGIGQPPVGVPAVGEHTRSVLLEAGYGSPEIDRLMAEGVVSE
jgi:crotonobetainyl-CoA:carnitine CoA-transferase CaiB-like acyl-CoA transferase